MKVHLATDHAGYMHKEAIKEFLESKEVVIVDHGAFMLAPDDDYPDFIKLAAEGVSRDEDDMAIIFGYSGEGEAMVANRYPTVRAGVYNGGNEEVIKLLREHNNANVLSIGAHFVAIDQAIQIVNLFLSTPFSEDGRHIRRLKKF